MIERLWSAVGPVALTASGSVRGKLTLSSTRGFRVKMQVTLEHPTLPPLNLEVKRVTGRYTLEVGPAGKITERTDVSAYDSLSTLKALEQRRPEIPLQELERATYAEEPAVAKRVLPVDEFGEPFGETNPLPVELQAGSIKIDSVQADLSVQLSHLDDSPVLGKLHDSVRIGDGTNQLAVNPDGSLNINIVESTTTVTEGMTLTHAQVSAVVSGVETDILTLLGGATGKRIAKIEASGENIAFYKIKINGTTVSTKRSWWTDFNVEWVFENVRNGLLLEAGKTLTVTAVHSRPSTASFEATAYSS